MVQEKKTKDEGWIARALKEATDSLGTVVGHRSFVVEVTPSEYLTRMHDDKYTPANIVRVSPYFDTQEEAEDWMSKHEADPYKFLAIKNQRLYERTVRAWH